MQNRTKMGEPFKRVEFKPKSYPENLLDKDWSKRKCFYHRGAEAFVDKVHDLEVRTDDVWVVTLPKCGTTWMQELVWLVVNNFDFETAKKEHLEVRTPFMEFDFLMYNDAERALLPVEQLQSPRVIKSHLQLLLLPAQIWTKKPKVIYVFRNLIDAWISGYYHDRSLGYHMDVTLEQYLENYIEHDALRQLPLEHAAEFYALRNEPWVFYTSFERMKGNLREVIAGVCQFLDKTITEPQMQQMLHHLSFEEMKNNPKTNHLWENDQVRQLNKLPFEQHNFIRKGKVGGYKEELSSEFVAKLEHFIELQLTSYKLTLDELLLLNNKQ